MFKENHLRLTHVRVPGEPYSASAGIYLCVRLRAGWGSVDDGVRQR